jgi:monoamine oxidase
VTSELADHGESCAHGRCLDQLARFFGEEAQRPRATLIADWAAEPLTTTALDLTDGGHPVGADGTWVTGPWQACLTLAESETSPTDPGYVNGAITAGQEAANTLESLTAVAR